MKGLFVPYRRHARAAPVGASALEARDLTVSYPGASVPALRDVSLQVPIGARVALVGPNGAGKSTLLKAAAGLLPVRAGTLRLHGLPVGACRAQVAYLPQRGEIEWRFPVSVRGMVMSGRYVHLGWLRRPRRQDHEAVNEALERLDLTPLAERQIGRLSGGQQQRTLLARALAQEADLLLLDEPLNAVDAATRAVIAAVLDDLRQRGVTVIVATHQIAPLRAGCDEVIVLQEGRVVRSAGAVTPADLQERDTAWV